MDQEINVVILVKGFCLFVRSFLLDWLSLDWLFNPFFLLFWQITQLFYWRLFLLLNFLRRLLFILRWHIFLLRLRLCFYLFFHLFCSYFLSFKRPLFDSFSTLSFNCWFLNEIVLFNSHWLLNNYLSYLWLLFLFHYNRFFSFFQWLWLFLNIFLWMKHNSLFLSLLNDALLLQEILNAWTTLIIDRQAKANQPRQALGIMRRNWRIFSNNYLQSKSSLRVRLKWMFACTKLVNQAAHCPNIRLFIIRLFLTHLRRQVIRCSNNSAGKVSSHCPCDSQIANPYRLIISQKHIHRLDISMKYLLCMQVLQPQHNLKRKSPNNIFIDWFSHLSLKELSKIASAAVLHTDVELFLLDERVKVLDDVRRLYVLHYFCLIQCLCQCIYTHYFIFLSIFFIYTSFKTHTQPSSFLRTLKTTPKEPLPSLVMISNYFKLINIMNEYKLQISKRKEEIADNLICIVLKRMGWSVTIPLEIRSLIISFLYRSFFSHPAMYTLLSALDSSIEGHKSHWLDEGCEYIAQTQSQRLGFKVSCWTGIQDITLDYSVRLFISFLVPVQDHFQREKIKFQGNQQDAANIFSVFKFLKRNRNHIFAAPIILRRVMKKNIIILTCKDLIYCIIGDIVRLSSFKYKVGLMYNHQQKRWKMSNNVLLWKKGVMPNRKKQWICFNKLQIFEIEGSFINKVERFPLNESTHISYQVE